MAEPAHQGDPAPAAPGWGEVRRALLTAAAECADVIAALREARGAADGQLAAAAEKAAAALRDAAAAVTPAAYEEAFRAQRERRDLEQGIVASGRHRRHLTAIPGTPPRTRS